MAALLSFTFVGFGQFYTGAFLRGLGFISVSVAISLVALQTYPPWAALGWLVVPFSTMDAYAQAKKA